MLGCGCNTIVVLHKCQQLFHRQNGSSHLAKQSRSWVMAICVKHSLLESVDPSGEIFADLFELGVGGVISTPIMVLVTVGHKIVLPGLQSILFEIVLQSLCVVSRISVPVSLTLAFSVESIHALLNI